MRDIKFKVNKPKKESQLLKMNIGGDLGLNNISEITERIVELVNKYQNFEISVDEVTAFDLSTLQMLIALKNTCNANDKKVKFNVNLNDDTKKLTSNTGFTKIISTL